MPAVTDAVFPLICIFIAACLLLIVAAVLPDLRDWFRYRRRFRRHYSGGQIPRRSRD